MRSIIFNSPLDGPEVISPTKDVPHSLVDTATLALRGFRDTEEITVSLHASCHAPEGPGRLATRR